MIELRNKYGAEYITSNFSYSILEIFDKKTSRDTVLTQPGILLEGRASDN